MAKERLDSFGRLHTYSSHPPCPSSSSFIISSLNYLFFLSSPSFPYFLSVSLPPSSPPPPTTLPPPCQHCLSPGAGVIRRVGGVSAFSRQHSSLLVPPSVQPPPLFSPSLLPSNPLSHWSTLPPPTLLSSASNEVIPSSRVKCSKCSERERSESRSERSRCKAEAAKMSGAVISLAVISTSC